MWDPEKCNGCLSKDNYISEEEMQEAINKIQLWTTAGLDKISTEMTYMEYKG